MCTVIDELIKEDRAKNDKKHKRELAKKDKTIATLTAEIAAKDARIAELDAEIAAKAALIAEREAQLAKSGN